MVKALSKEEQRRRSLIEEAVFDFYGSGVSSKVVMKVHAALIANSISGLSDEERKVLKAVKLNLSSYPIKAGSRYPQNIPD